MTYFLRISSNNRPANQLQTQAMREVEKYDHFLTDNPAQILTAIDKAVQHANYTFRRCTALTVRGNRDYKTKELESISVGHLVSLSILKVAGSLGLVEAPTVTRQLAPTMPAPLPAPESATAPGVVPDSLPRAVIYKRREGYEEARLECWTKFTEPVQALLKKGAIWRIYLDSDQKTIVEEYGGVTRFAYL